MVVLLLFVMNFYCMRTYAIQINFGFLREVDIVSTNEPFPEFNINVFWIKSPCVFEGCQSMLLRLSLGYQSNSLLSSIIHWCIVPVVLDYAFMTFIIKLTLSTCVSSRFVFFSRPIAHWRNGIVIIRNDMSW